MVPRGITVGAGPRVEPARTTHRSIRLKLPTAACSLGIVTENGKTYQETLRQDGAEFVFFLRGGLFRVTLPQGGP